MTWLLVLCESIDTRSSCYGGAQTLAWSVGVMKLISICSTCTLDHLLCRLSFRCYRESIIWFNQ